MLGVGGAILLGVSIDGWEITSNQLKKTWKGIVVLYLILIVVGIISYFLQNKGVKL